MLRHILCSERLRSAIAHGHVALRHVSSRTTGAAISSRTGSQSYLTKRFIRRTPTMSAIAPTEHKHINRLAKEQSPYLLQHQYNPVSCLLPCRNVCAPAMPAALVILHRLHSTVSASREAMPLGQAALAHETCMCRSTGIHGGKRHLTRRRRTTNRSSSASATRRATGASSVQSPRLACVVAPTPPEDQHSLCATESAAAARMVQRQYITIPKDAADAMAACWCFGGHPDCDVDRRMS